VYKIKYKPDGTILRHKARLVVRGFQQVKDKDYKHKFSPVAKLTTVRLFIALAAAKDWPLHQLDINNAILMFICNLFQAMLKLYLGRFVSYRGAFMASNRLLISGILN